MPEVPRRGAGFRALADGPSNRSDLARICVLRLRRPGARLLPWRHGAVRHTSGLLRPQLGQNTMPTASLGHGCVEVPVPGTLIRCGLKMFGMLGVCLDDADSTREFSLPRGLDQSKPASSAQCGKSHPSAEGRQMRTESYVSTLSANLRLVTLYRAMSMS